MNKININVNKNTFLYLIIYGGSIVIICLIFIFPLYLKTTGTVRENETLKTKIQEQKDLAPVYATLINDIKNKDALALPNPVKKPVTRSEETKFENEVRAIAKKSGLTVVSFEPDVIAAQGAASHMNSVVLRGPYAGLRKIIIGLGAIPYLEKIEEISCQQGTDYMTFKMKIWTAIK
jgi:hypothetical protein